MAKRPGAELGDQLGGTSVPQADGLEVKKRRVEIKSRRQSFDKSCSMVAAWAEHILGGLATDLSGILNVACGGCVVYCIRKITRRGV